MPGVQLRRIASGPPPGNSTTSAIIALSVGLSLGAAWAYSHVKRPTPENVMSTGVACGKSPRKRRSGKRHKWGAQNDSAPIDSDSEQGSSLDVSPDVTPITSDCSVKGQAVHRENNDTGTGADSRDSSSDGRDACMEGGAREDQTVAASTAYGGVDNLQSVAAARLANDDEVLERDGPAYLTHVDETGDSNRGGCIAVERKRRLRKQAVAETTLTAKADSDSTEGGVGSEAALSPARAEGTAERMATSSADTEEVNGVFKKLRRKKTKRPKEASGSLFPKEASGSLFPDEASQDAAATAQQILDAELDARDAAALAAALAASAAYAQAAEDEMLREAASCSSELCFPDQLAAVGDAGDSSSDSSPEPGWKEVKAKRRSNKKLGPGIGPAE